MPQRFVAAACQVPRDTLEAWLQNDEEFATIAREAEAEGIYEKLRRVGSGGDWKTVQGAAWVLERRYPGEFGQRQQVEHSGPGGAPMLVLGAVEHRLTTGETKQLPEGNAIEGEA